MQKNNIIENIQILHESSSFFVIDKPAGIVVNRSDTQGNNFTIQDFAEQRINKANVSDESEFIRRGGIVHRLDKETSGVMIIAKNEDAFYTIQKQFKDKVVSKTYIALCHGKVTPESGEIAVPIGRLPWNRMRFGIVVNGREAVTMYKVVKYFFTDSKEKECLSLIEAYPKTGRTHQIRVHMQYIHYPIFADSLYAGRKTIKKDRKLLPRHFLHASQITFFNPDEGSMLTVKSDLPKDLQNFLTTLTE